MANMEGCGTVVASKNFDPETDSKVLRKSMKGFGTDEDAIIGVISARSVDQLKVVESKYKEAFGRCLLKDLKNELGGNLEAVVLGRFMHPREYDASCLRSAMKGMGTDESALINILCTKSNSQINEIKELYKTMFERDLEKDVMKECSGDFENLLVSLLQAGRQEDLKLDMEMAQREAKALFEAGEDKWGTDESTFNQIFAMRSYEQLRATFAEYLKLAGRNMEAAIAKEMTGNRQKGFVTLVQVINDPYAYYAKMMHDSMKGFGTDDQTLIRVIVAHCETDMKAIKKKFKTLYTEDLDEWVKSDCSGDYEKMMLALIRNPTE